MTMEAETGAMVPQVKECQGLPETPEAKRKAWNIFSLRTLVGTNPANTLISNFQPPEL